MRILRLLLLVLFGLAAVPLGASAQSYWREWKNVCGGSSFTTCVSVQLTVSSTNVTISAWNLSGGTAGGYAGSIIRSISLLNVPSAVYTATSNTTSGTYYKPSGQPNPFQITDTNSDKGGEITLSKNSMLLNKTGTVQDSLANGMASSCAAGSSKITGIRLWMSPTDGCATTEIANSSKTGPNHVQFNFALNQSFDPNLANVKLGITSIDMSSPLVTSNFIAYATPEPATMTLLGSGLLGLAGIGRRRRRQQLRREQGAL